MPVNTEKELNESAKVPVIERVVDVGRYYDPRHNYLYGLVRVYLPAEYIGRRVKVLIIDVDSIVKKFKR